MDSLSGIERRAARAPSSDRTQSNPSQFVATRRDFLEERADGVATRRGSHENAREPEHVSDLA